MVTLARASELSLSRRNRRDYDQRRYPICPPFYGERGQEFLLFERDFLAGISDIGDEFALLIETLKGTDALPPNPGAGERRMHQKRRRDLYGKLYKHVENERIREQFATLGNDGRLAWELLERECRVELTDVEILELEGDWARANILSHVGYHESSITDFLRHLNALNARFPFGGRKDQNALAVKLLSSIDSPPELAVLATQELMLSPATAKFRRVINAGAANQAFERDPDAIAIFFDELWRNNVKRGVIKRKAATTSSPGNNRVDEGVLQANDVLASSDACTDANDPADDAGFALRGLGGRNARDASDSICYRCYGLGHVANNCASDAAVKHSPEEVIRRLSQQFGKQQKPPHQRAMGQKVAGKGPAPRGNTRKPAPQKRLVINGKAYVLDEADEEEEVNQAAASSSPLGHDATVDESNLVNEYDGEQGSDDFAFCAVAESSTVLLPATIFDSDLSDDEIFAATDSSGESSSLPRRLHVVVYGDWCSHLQPTS